MVVTKAGASGHNIRSRPSLKAAPVGMLALGDSVNIEEYVSTLIKILSFFKLLFISYYLLIMIN